MICNSCDIYKKLQIGLYFKVPNCILTRWIEVSHLIVGDLSYQKGPKLSQIAQSPDLVFGLLGLN